MENESQQHVNSPFTYLKERLEGSKDSYGMLMKEIVKAGICTHCSACCAVCDVLDWDADAAAPKLVGKCTGCGICYNQCPRTITIPEQLIGNFRSAWIAKSTAEGVTGQDGGATTSLLLYMLDKELVDGAVVTKRTENWRAVPTFAKTREEIMAASGSLYVHSQTVDALFKALSEGNHAIAFVGTPCNIDALAKMENSPFGMMLYNLRNRIFKIGLFCMDSFAPETLYGFFERDAGIALKDVKKMDISMGKFNIYDASGEAVKKYGLKALHKYKSSSCNFCTDLTSEYADVSFGSVGSPDGYNTVLCRTAIGELLLKDAAAHGYLEIKEITADDLDAVYRLAKMKKVSQYNVQVRKQYIFTPPESSDATASQATTASAAGGVPELQLAYLLKKLKLRNAKLVNKRETVKFTLENTSGYIMENLEVRISLVEDVFEKAAWATKVTGLYPYESMVFDYPVELAKKEQTTLQLMVEARIGGQLLLNETISMQKLIDKANEAAAKKAAKKKG